MNVIAEKSANALFQNAAPKGLANRAHLVTVIYRLLFRGLWVGGTVYLTDDSLTFQPNTVNRRVHQGELSRTFPLREVVSAADRFGIGTRIVDVRFADGAQFTFRCFGAKEFAQKILHQRTSSK